MSNKPVIGPLPIHRTTQTQNKRIHRHPCLEGDSNPPFPAFERACKDHGLDRAATVIGMFQLHTLMKYYTDMLIESTQNYSIIQ
jgi:hypothetical protein